MPSPRQQTPSGGRRPPSASSGPLARAKPIGFDGNDGLKVLLYGQSGSGKTTLAATFPAPLLWITCSGGTRPGELRSVDTPENRERIQQLVLESSEEVLAIAREVPGAGFKTVVMDHISGLEDLTLKEIMGVDELPAQKSWGMASQGQYGECANKTKEYLRALLNLASTCNIVLIGQERTFGGRDEGNSDDGIKPVVGAAVMPSVARWLFPACDYLLQTFRRPRMEKVKTQVGKTVMVTEKRGKGVEYCIRTEPHDVYQTKFRSPNRGANLPEAVVDPTYDKIMSLIRGE